jgi:Leucine rich repeat
MMPPVAEGSDESVYPHHQNEGHDEYNKSHHHQSQFTDFMRRYKWYVLGSVVTLVLILGISIGVSNKGNSATAASVNTNNLGAGVTDTAGSDSTDPLERKKADLMGRIKSSFVVLGLPESHITMLGSPESPQARALQWVAESLQYETYSDDQKLQRYALASFFYATYAVRNAYVTQQVPWTTAEKWLSEEHECDWEGITCNAAPDETGAGGNRVVVSIELEEHRITGSIPLDLVLLRESLTTIILTNNLIFMEGDALMVFSYLENLEVLLLADNYIVERNGLPESLRALPKLEKLILSYNLLQGNIRPNYFESMAKLTHLEVESNYLSGPLPTSVFSMEQLVYLYVRRNAFSFNFAHAISSANWPNMCKFFFEYVFHFEYHMIIRTSDSEHAL